MKSSKKLILILLMVLPFGLKAQIELPRITLCDNNQFFLKATLNSSGNYEFVLFENNESDPNKQEFTLNILTIDEFSRVIDIAIGKQSDQNKKPTCLVPNPEAETEEEKKQAISAVKSYKALLFNTIVYGGETIRNQSFQGPIAGQLFTRKEGRLIRLPQDYSFTQFYKNSYDWYYGNHIEPERRSIYERELEKLIDSYLAKNPVNYPKRYLIELVLANRKREIKKLRKHFGPDTLSNKTQKMSKSFLKRNKSEEDFPNNELVKYYFALKYTLDSLKEDASDSLLEVLSLRYYKSDFQIPQNSNIDTLPISLIDDPLISKSFLRGLAYSVSPKELKRVFKQETKLRGDENWYEFAFNFIMKDLKLLWDDGLDRRKLLDLIRQKNGKISGQDSLIFPLNKDLESIISERNSTRRKLDFEKQKIKNFENEVLPLPDTISKYKENLKNKGYIYKETQKTDEQIEKIKLQNVRTAEYNQGSKPDKTLIDPKESNGENEQILYWLSEIDKAEKRLIAIKDSIQNRKVRVNFLDGLSLKLANEIDDLSFDLEWEKKYQNELFLDRNQLCDFYFLKEEKVIDPSFDIEDIEIEFNEGYIENLIVEGKFKIIEESPKGCPLSNSRISKPLKLENLAPIGFSRKLDYEALKKTHLYTRGEQGPVYAIALGQVIENYKYNLALNRRDYSPQNRILVVKGGQMATLYKPPTYRLLEAKVFTDFVGINEKSPNGLIQTELAKKININTERFAFSSIVKANGEIKRFLKPNIHRRTKANFTVFSFIEPTFTVSKIEEDDRQLVIQSLDTIQNNSVIREKYAGTMDLFNYESMNVGLRTNVALFDFPSLKSTININWGINFGRTPIRDFEYSIQNNMPFPDKSQEKDSIVTNIRNYFEFEVVFKPEERYGLALSYRVNKFFLRSNYLRNVADPELFQLNRANRYSNDFHTLQLLGFFIPGYRPDKDQANKMFFRFTHNYMHKRWNSNFLQVQIGYSFYLQSRYQK